MRGSDADASVYYLAVMIAGGEDPKFIARRMIVFASEDVGNADPRALEVAVATARAVEFVGLPECRINLSQCAAYLARAPKSNEAYKAISAALDDVRERGALRPPPHLRDGSYPGAKALGHGVGYRYPPSDPAAAADQQYLPDELVNRRYHGEYRCQARLISQECACRRRSRPVRRPGCRWRCARPAPGSPRRSPAT